MADGCGLLGSGVSAVIPYEGAAFRGLVARSGGRPRELADTPASRTMHTRVIISDGRHFSKNWHAAGAHLAPPPTLEISTCQGEVVAPYFHELVQELRRPLPYIDSYDAGFTAGLGGRNMLDERLTADPTIPLWPVAWGGHYRRAL